MKKKISNLIKKKNKSKIVSLTAYSKNIATILDTTSGEEVSILNLRKNFDLIKNPKLEHFYDMANFYKDRNYFEESV